MVDATIKPPLKFPKNNTNINMTINPPSNRLEETVLVVFSIKEALSIKGLMLMPFGKDFSISTTRSFTLAITSLEFSPLSINIIPPTASPSPFLVKEPKRTA